MRSHGFSTMCCLLTVCALIAGCGRSAPDAPAGKSSVQNPTNAEVADHQKEVTIPPTPVKLSADKQLKLERELQVFADRINDLPFDIDDWQGSKLAFEDGGLSREYTNRFTKESVRIDILCGKMPDLVLANPDITYPANGHLEIGSVSRLDLVCGGKDKLHAQFKTAQFGIANSTRSVRILWGWSNDGNWEAPDSPKTKFSAERGLYKIFVQHSVENREPEEANDSPSARFTQIVMPKLNEVCFP